MQGEKLNKAKLATYVEDTLAKYVADHGFGPSLRDLCKLCGVRSTSTMREILDELVRQGLIEYTPNVARSARPTRRA